MMRRLGIAAAYAVALLVWIYALPQSPALLVGFFVLVNMGLGATAGGTWPLFLACLVPLLALPRWDAGSLGWAYWWLLIGPAAALIAFGLALRRLAERDLGGQPQSQRS